MERADIGKFFCGTIGVVVLCVLLLLVIVLAVCFAGVIFSISQSNDVEASCAIVSIDKVSSAVEAKCGECASSEFETLLELARATEVDRDELENAKLGRPFIINQIDDMDKVLIYYYPIIDKDTGNVLCVAGLWQTSEGWTYDMSTEYARELNDVGYSDDSYIFYAHDKSIMADNGKSVVLFMGPSDEELQNYAQKSMSEKLNDLSYVLESAHILDIDSVQRGDEDIKAGVLDDD